MQTLKYILIAIGVIAILLTIFFVVVGFKVVSTVFSYIIGAIAVFAIIGFIIYFMGKAKGKNE